MTAERFRQCLDAMLWTSNGLADYLDITRATGHRWANGQRQVPPHVAAWLERLAAAHEAAPYPEGWADGPAGAPPVI